MNAEIRANDLGARGDGLLHRNLTSAIIGRFYEVYNVLGFGLLERAYTEALALELRDRGHTVRREVATELRYKGHLVAIYRMDLVVDDLVVVEVKSTKRLGKEDPRQLLNYLRVSRFEVGLLLHFGPQPLFYRLASTNRG